MIEFGKTLREAREARGYTVSQVAEITRMLPSIVDGLEREDFSKIAAPIYGRGFVKLYAEAVGLEVKPLVNEFMDIYNGNRTPVILEREASTEPPAPAMPEAPDAPQPKPVPQPEPEPQPEPPAASLFRLEAEPVPTEKPRPRPQPAINPTVNDEPIAEVPLKTAEPTFSRYASPIRDEPRRPMLPANLWRIAVLTAAGLLILWGVLIVLRALYNATMPKAAAPAAETQSVSEAQATAAAEAPTQTPQAPAQPRSPKKIPSLYMD